MPRKVACPFCKGCGVIDADEPPRVPRGWVTLPVLAARVGVTHATAHKHLVAELLHAEWGEYRRGRGNRLTRAYFVSPQEQSRYRAWLGLRANRKARYRTAEYVQMLEAGESAEVIAEKFKIKPASVQRFAARRRKNAATKAREER